MKKKILLLFALMASVMGVKAQNYTGDIISIANLVNTIPGYTAGGSFDIVLNSTNTDDWALCQLSLTFPEGVTWKSQTADEAKGDILLDGHTVNRTWVSADNKLNIQIYNPSENTNFGAKTGTLAHITFSVDQNASLGMKSLSVTDIVMSTISNAGYHVHDFNVDFEIDNTTFTIDENARTAYAAPSGTFNVKVKRKLKADVWNTIMLPFAVPQDKITTVFGEGTSVARFSNAEYTMEENPTDPDDEICTGIKVVFSSITTGGMQAAKPYLIKVTSEKNLLELNDVSTFTTSTANAYFNKNNVGRMYGTFICQDVPSGKLYISNNQFKYSGGHATIKGLRGYLDLYTTLYNYLPDPARAITFDIDGESTTGIFNLEEGTIETGGKYYNLKGQRVANPTKGVYVVEGKKVMIK